MNPTRVMTMVAALALGACATSQNPIYGPGDVDQPPELYGCPTVEMGAGETIEVDVIMVIDREGDVESVRRSPRPRTSAREQVPDDLVRRAEETARNCEFAPATRNGVPVRYRLTKTFTFSWTGM